MAAGPSAGAETVRPNSTPPPIPRLVVGSARATNPPNAAPTWSCRCPAAPSSTGCGRLQQRFPGRVWHWPDRAHRANPSCHGWVLAAAKRAAASAASPLTGPAHSRGCQARRPAPRHANARPGKPATAATRPLLRRCPAATPRSKPRHLRPCPAPWPGHRAPGAAHPTRTTRRQTHAAAARLHPTAHWRPRCRWRWASQNAPSLWAGRLGPG